MAVLGLWLLGFMTAGFLAQQDVIAATSQSLTMDRASATAGDYEYILGPGDQVTVTIADSELPADRPFLVDVNGSIRLPMIGRIHVAGLTTTELESVISEGLKTYFVKPDVMVAIAEYGSQPVSIIGAVKTPGIHQVRGRKTILEMLSLAGGLEENAGVIAKITRELQWGLIPLQSTSMDSTGQFSVAEINLKSLISGRNPSDNILIRPHDVISVPKADVVYVIGQVLRSGAFVITEHKQVTVLQALSMAAGLDRMANPKEARILRLADGSSTRTEIEINLKNIMAGRSPDIPMIPEDILFVPDNTPKRAGLRTLEAIVQMTTGAVIWRR